MNNKKNSKITRPVFLNKNDRCFVSEEAYEFYDSDMEINERKKAEYGISSTVCDDGTPFDEGPSGGANSPFTVVNSENQSVINEVPKNPQFYPDK